MKKVLTIIVINIACLSAFLALQAASAVIIAPLHPGRAMTAWAGQSGERFAQLAVFFPPGYGFDEEAIFNTRRSLDSSLLAVSLESNDDRKQYADAWSAYGSVSVTGERGSATVPAIGTGGDYFLFHPLFLRNGSYISAGDIMRDRVVLDENLAWRLFGSMNLAGLEVIINGRPFLIAGVVARESGFAYDRALDYDNAYAGGAGIFMSYEALRDMPAPEGETAAGISSYEIVMPDVITDFALNSIKTALGDESVVIVSNTSRFDYGNLFNLIGSFGERSMHPDTVPFPYWENAVRYAEDWLALLLFFSLIVMVCPAVFAVIYGIKLIRFCIRKGKDTLRAGWKKREQRVYRRYLEDRSRTNGRAGSHLISRPSRRTLPKQKTL